MFDKSLDKSYNQSTGEFDCLPGNHIDEVTKSALSVAKEYGEIVHFYFNDVKIRIGPLSAISFVYKDYSNARTLEQDTIGPIFKERYSDEYETLLEEAEKTNRILRSEREKFIKEEIRKKKEDLEKTLLGKMFCVKPDLSDEYYNYISIQTKPSHSARITEYARHVGALCQDRMLKTLLWDWNSDFEKACTDCDYDGITGFMHSTAVAILKKYWVYGDSIT